MIQFQHNLQDSSEMQQTIQPWGHEPFNESLRFNESVSNMGLEGFCNT